MYKPNFEELDKLVDSGHLRKVISPCSKFKIYNYTDHCTFDRNWNEHTLNARGTVYEIDTGKIVARAFPKFFNYSELDDSKKDYVNSCAAEKMEVYEKADGSLGILGFYGGKWRITTRGSFTSDQAVYASQKLLPKYDMSEQDKDSTYMVEIVYPQNKIIVDYGDTKELVLLSAISIETGGSPMWEYNERVAKETGMRLCKKYDISTIEELVELQNTLPYTEEGFVARFPGKNIERVKFKSLEYLKVAKIMNHMSPLSFWGAMIDGKVRVDFMEQLPEEFRIEADKLLATMELKYDECRAEVLSEFANIMMTLGGDGSIDDCIRKDLGLYLKDNDVKHSSAMFSMLLGKNIDKYIMKTIRPTGNNLTE
jgi:RNA ligase